jgi:F-type H+-transporting ATPase subunit delta
MAELATIARPYAEALFRAVSDAAAAEQLAALSAVAQDAQMIQFAGHPSAKDGEVFGLINAVAGLPLSANVQNLLRTVIENGRLTALPEIAQQYHVLVNAKSGVSDATVYSAFPLDKAQVDDLTAALQKRFDRKLNASVIVQPDLIGGVRVVVGDEVLDTSVKARLESMKAALTA